MKRLATVLMLLAFLAPVPVAAADGVLIRGATVHTVSGRTIEGGSVLLRDGKIAAVGRSVDASGAQVVEATGQHVYPGLIDCDTVLGLVEISAVRATRDYGETGDVTPNVRAELAVNPDSELLPVTRANGILYAYTAPRGGRISGMGAVMRLDGWTWEDMTVLAPAGLGVEWPRMTIDRRPRARTEPEEQEKQREKALETLRDAFDTARAYLKARDAADAGEGPPIPVDSRWEAMRPVLSGEVPVVVRADDLTQIEAAVAWAGEQGLRLILAGGEDAWRAADLLAEKEIPVLLGQVLSLPRREWEPYDTAYRNAAILHDAGVEFCFTASGGSSFDAAHTRNLPYEAAMATAFGLPPEAAVRGMTLAPATILGLADRLGSIEEGKDASVILTSGDVLDIRTEVLRAWIDGREVSLESRHTRLYERYRSRP